jgi:hypothetical protein
MLQFQYMLFDNIACVWNMPENILFETILLSNNIILLDNMFDG